MEIKKAIEWQSAFKHTYKGDPMEKEVLEVCDMAIEALKKEEPVTLYVKYWYSIPVCTKCKGLIDLTQGELNYCPNCGQRLEGI